MFGRVRRIKIHLAKTRNSLPYADSIILLATPELDALTQEIHFAAYCVDGEFRDDDHLGQAEVMTTFTGACLKVFHSSPDRLDRCQKALLQFGTYLQNDARTMPPWKFWRLHGLAMPELRLVAMTVLEQVIADSGAEKDWKEFKCIHNKLRHALPIAKVAKHLVVTGQMRLDDAVLSNKKAR